MLSPEERRLIAGILALLLFGAAINAWRSRVEVRETGKTVLPSVLPGGKELSRE